MVFLTAPACNKDDPGAGGKQEEVDGLQFYEPVDQLVRISMALRGIRPSVEELEAVDADPSALEGIVDAYLDSPQFGLTIRDMHNEMLLLRTDTELQLPSVGVLAGVHTGEIFSATTEAPLRLIEHIVMNDDPYTEIVQADYMLANEMLSWIYGVPWDPAGDEWQISHWVDGRPHAGVLSSSELWRRHVSNGSNFHRGRADMLADVFLCESFGDRDIVVDGGIDLSDEFAVAHAVKELEGCIGCHQALDPLAGFLWGWKIQIMALAVKKAEAQDCYWAADAETDPPPGGLPADYCYPLVMYTPANEGDWEDWDLRPPSYYGQPGGTLDDLGKFMADDPRFSQCAAKNFYAYLTQEDREHIPLDLAVEFQDLFIASNYDAKALAKAIVMSDYFNATRAYIPVDMHPPAGLQSIRPEQFRRTIEDLTGFEWWATIANECGDTWCWKEVHLGESDLYGYRAMSGGIDGMQVTRPTHTATPVKTMTMGRYAYEAAAHAVDRDFENPDYATRRLLTLVDAADKDEDLVRKQLVALHKRILGELVGRQSDVVDESYIFWNAALERHSGDTTTAWKMSIAALLQDPRMIYY